MNCESVLPLLNAALDDELSPGERTDMQQHLEECSVCREQWGELQLLHRDLAATFRPPSVDQAVGRILQALPNAGSAKSLSSEALNRHSRARSTRRSQLAVVIVVCVLMITFGAALPWSTATPAVAEVSLATGRIEYKPSDSRDWIAIDASSRMPLPARSRIRTGSTSVCELRTKSDAIVRLNQQTELILLKPAKVELVTGELWCRAPASAGVEICTTSQSSQAPPGQVFTCPSDTEMQWRALPDKQVSCLDVASTPAQIKSSQATCTIQPGECLTFGSGILKSESRNFDTVEATNWQLPLLVLRNPHDFELRDRLTGILSMVGRSKAAYLYEDQIRNLGSPGAIPLLAYVRSPDSLTDQDLRLRAMGFAAELAGKDSLPDLEALLEDSDATVRTLAARAIRRLQPGRTISD